MIRPFELQDLSSLYRLSGRGVFLDTRLELTGELRSLQSALWSSLLPGSRTRIYIWQGAEAGNAFAQVRHLRTSSLSRLLYISPRQVLDSPGATELVEGLLVEAGRNGARHVLAEAEEGSEVFAFLRRECFAIYARQDVWRQDQPRVLTPEVQGTLRPELPIDSSQIRSLYASIVPGLIQQVEPAPKPGRGWVLVQEGELVGYFRLHAGERGSWVEPFFHPAARDVAEAMQVFLNGMRPSSKRAVYVCVRSYQDWLGPILQHAGLALAGEQAVLVRRTVVPVTEARPVPVTAIEHGATRATPIRGG